LIRVRFASPGPATNPDASTEGESFDFSVPVQGMTCGHCKMNVERAAAAVPGVETVEADLNRHELRVKGNVSREAISKAVEEAGYSVD